MSLYSQFFIVAYRSTTFNNPSEKVPLRYFCCRLISDVSPYSFRSFVLCLSSTKNFLFEKCLYLRRRCRHITDMPSDDVALHRVSLHIKGKCTKETGHYDKAPIRKGSAWGLYVCWCLGINSLLREWRHWSCFLPYPLFFSFCNPVSVHSLLSTSCLQNGLGTQPPRTGEQQD